MILIDGDYPMAHNALKFERNCNKFIVLLCRILATFVGTNILVLS